MCFRLFGENMMRNGRLILYSRFFASGTAEAIGTFEGSGRHLAITVGAAAEVATFP